MAETHKKEINRDKVIKNVKTGGDILMYVGSAALVGPQVQKSKDTQNGILGACASGAGIVLSVGLGAFASGIFNKAVDKVVDFWDDVKPKESDESGE